MCECARWDVKGPIIVFNHITRVLLTNETHISAYKVCVSDYLRAVIRSCLCLPWRVWTPATIDTNNRALKLTHAFFVCLVSVCGKWHSDGKTPPHYPSEYLIPIVTAQLNCFSVHQTLWVAICKDAIAIMYFHAATTQSPVVLQPLFTS